MEANTVAARVLEDPAVSLDDTVDLNPIAALAFRLEESGAYQAASRLWLLSCRACLARHYDNVATLCAQRAGRLQVLANAAGRRAR